MRNFGVGAALGIFLGLLIGLSVSEVVAGIVTGLVAILGTLFGLRSAAAAGPIPGGNGARIAGFALAATLALLAALLARTHGWLEPTPHEIQARWVAAGFSAKDASDLAAFQRLGLVPAGRTAGEAKTSKAGTGALYASHSDDDACEALLGRRYGSADAMASALNAEGGVWKQLAASIPADTGEAARLAALKAAVAALCKEQ